MDELLEISWLGVEEGILVKVRYPEGKISGFSQITLSNGSDIPLDPPSFVYGLLIRIALWNVVLNPYAIQELSSTYRKNGEIPYTYTPPTEGGDGIVSFVINKLDTNPANGWMEWYTECSKGYMCVVASNSSVITWRYSNVINTGGVITRGAPTIIGTSLVCSGSSIDFIAFSQELLVKAYQITVKGVAWGWQEFTEPLVAGTIETMAINPKETDVVLELRDTLNDVYRFNIGYYINKKVVLWTTNTIRGYGGIFYG